MQEVYPYAVPEVLLTGRQDAGMLRGGPLSEETREHYELQLQHSKKELLRFERALRSEKASVQTGQQRLQDLLARLAEAAPEECSDVPSPKVSKTGIIYLCLSRASAWNICSMHIPS